MNRKGEMIGNLCGALEALLCQVNPIHVLWEDEFYDSFTCQDVGKLLLREEDGTPKERTEIECKNIIDSLNHYMAGRDDLRLRVTRPELLHVFELLSDVSEHLLLMDNGRAECIYNYILQWRTLVQSIGEELPVTAMYVISDLARGISSRKRFDWDYVTGHNNEPLNQLLAQGISDHHLHLWASMPYFQVSWINLMNHVEHTEYIRHLQEIDREDWNLRQNSRRKKEELVLQQQRRLMNGQPLERMDSSRIDALPTMHLQAALIRVYLCARLNGKQIYLSDFNALEEAKKKKLSNTPCPALTQAEYEKAIEQQRQWDLQEVYFLLREPQQLFMKARKIQSIIASFQGLDMGPYLDYAHSMNVEGVAEDTPIQLAYTGERWFLYSMLKDIYLTFPKLERREHNLFYVYEMLYLKIRKKLVQVEKQIGFDYFQKIQKRKSYFIDDPKSVELVMRLAVEAPLVSREYLTEIEARISPRETEDQLYRDIEALENAGKCVVYTEDGREDLLKWEEMKKRYYYVLHFTKREDKHLPRTKERFTFENRHALFREKLVREAEAILQLRRRYPKQALRVLGIDACSQEIGCRPENFAYIFRLLSHDVCEWNDYGVNRPLPKLRMTFHVGEDFLDIADGLRAIDEAIHFLGLDCGDRLGHTLALSIPAEKWYEDKNRQIFLPIQDYLDNLAWIYYCIYHYHLPDLQRESRFLKHEFERYFREIYLNHMDPEETKGFVRAAVEYYKDKSYAQGYQFHDCSFSIDDYIRSWMLRGDDPSLYKEGYFKQNELMYNLDERERWKRNNRFPADISIRYTPECTYLNFCYHYNAEVRRAGAEKRTVTVDERYIQAVKAVQNALRFDVAKRGLSVEGNPTSNLKISLIQSYQEHPITNLFNRGLYHSEQMLRGCPQVPVSINTDDGGVFFTSLENEYAVITRALELREENGTASYFRWEIYDWVDAIRKNGNAQSFQRGKVK